MIQSTKTYLQTELNSYPPYNVTHIGWQAGASRDFFDLPPEVDADRQNYGPTEWYSYEFEGWGQKYGGTNIPPHVFYVLWKYAQALGYTQAQAQDLFDRSKGRLDTTPPSNDVFVRHPFVLNSFINGYQGYLELQKMAGYPESLSIGSQLSSLRSLRAETFARDTYYIYGAPNFNVYCRAFSASANFIYLTPDLGDYLRRNALSKVQAALDEYYHYTPYWFVARYEDTIQEGIFAPLYDTNLLQAKALILKEPREELVKYLDVPVFARGDLFYIQNLVAAIEAPSAAPTINKSVPLVTGWNLVALPLTPTSATPSILFAPIAGQLDSVLAYDGCDTADPWKKYDPKAPSFTNDLTEVGVGRGLWIRTTANTTLTVTGSAPSSVSIALSAGPNLISYPSSASVSLPDGLASITGKFNKVFAYDAADTADPWKTFDPSAPSVVNDLRSMGPGKGYWIEMKEPGILQINP